MPESNIQPTILTLDTKKYRLRVYKATIHQIGDPKLIQLLIHPEKKLIAIQSGSPKVEMRYKIKVEKQMLNADDSVEMYSKDLICRILKVCPEIKSGYSYNLTGRIIVSKETAVFSLSTATMIDCNTGESYV